MMKFMKDLVKPRRWEPLLDEPEEGRRHRAQLALKLSLDIPCAAHSKDTQRRSRPRGARVWAPGWEPLEPAWAVSLGVSLLADEAR